MRFRPLYLVGPLVTLVGGVGACSEDSSQEASEHDGGAPNSSLSSSELDAGTADAEGPPDASDGGFTPRNVEYETTCGSQEVYWPEEADIIRWTIRCSTALVEATGLPEGAKFDPSSGTIEWTPRLDQAGPFSIVVKSTKNVATRISGTVLDRFDAPDNVPLVDRTQYLEEHGLPVIHLSWHSDEPNYCKDAIRRDPVPADIIVNGVAHVGSELRCRGQTSLAFPKKSFTLRFAKDDPFHAPPSLAAFEGRRRLILTQTFDDNSQVRTRMGFELWNRLDPANIRIDHASVVVYVDSVYQGLYQLTDDVGDHLMAASGFDKDGAIFKSEAHTGNYRATTNSGAAKKDLTVGYEKSDGEPEDDFSALITLLEWVSESTPEEFESSVDDMLRTEDFLDWYVFATTLLAYDNFAKNSHVYIDTDGPDTRFRYIPWDLNGTWGQSWDRQRILPTSAGKDAPEPVMMNGIWQRIAEIPTLHERLDARFAAALAGPMNVDSVLALFDQMTAEVRPSALRDDRRWDAARRAYPLWTAHGPPTTFDIERAFVRAWIQERWAYLTSLY